MQVRPSPAPSPRANASGCGAVAAWRSWAGRRWTSTPAALALPRLGASPADVPERLSPGLQTRATGSTSQTLGVVEGAWGSAALTREVAPGGTYTSVHVSLWRSRNAVARRRAPDAWILHSVSDRRPYDAETHRTCVHTQSTHASRPLVHARACTGAEHTCTGYLLLRTVLTVPYTVRNTSDTLYLSMHLYCSVVCHYTVYN